MANYLTNTNDLMQVADAIRQRGGTSEPLEFPSEFVSAIRAIPSEGGGDSWERPEGWPDLDSIDLADFEGSYYTYDTTLMPTGGYDSVHLVGTTQNGGNYIVERGHLQNGLFIADDTFTCKTNVVFDQPIDVNDGVYQVWRARPVDGDHLTKLMFGTPWQFTYQPCVERVSRLPYVTSLYQDHAYTARWKGRYIRREKLVDFAAVTTMNSAFTELPALECIDFVDCDFDNVTSLSNTFSLCRNLKFINFKNTSFRNITNMNETFRDDIALVELDITSFNLSNVTTLLRTFQGLLRVKELKADWCEMPNLTSMSYTFSSMYGLDELNLTGLSAPQLTGFTKLMENANINWFIIDGNFPAITSATYMLGNADNVVFKAAGAKLSGDFSYGTGKTMLDVTGLDCSESGLSFNGNCGSIIEMYPPVQYFSHTYSSVVLSHASLIRIINNLAEVTETQTLTIGERNLAKLSSAEIAVATEKGWTLA